MKILAITDAHDLAGFLNIAKMIDLTHPDLLLSCGDWGSVNPNPKHPTEFELMDKLSFAYAFVPILSKVPVLSLYGNHDYLEVLETLKNEYNNMKMLIPDIEPVYYEGVKIMGINGNYAWKKKMPWHKTFYELESFSDLLDFSDKLKASLKDLDIFMTHEQPTTIPETKRLGQPILTEIAHKLKPKIHLSGHVHHPAKFFDGTTVYVNLGMALHGDYAIIDTALMSSDSLERSVELKKLGVLDDSSVQFKR